MTPPVIAGPPVVSRIMLLGQAPGSREGSLGRPFAWTAGRTLFGWFKGLGIDEAAFRRSVYIAAVCRCFPGKTKSGGDRVPNRGEVENCASWLRAEVEILRPQLLIPVGRLAIAQVLPRRKLVEVVGKSHRARLSDHELDVIPLPHPSGASTWFQREPGKTLLGEALGRLALHPAFVSLLHSRD